MFVVLSEELAWTLRNRAQSHVAVNFKCIFKYAHSLEEVCKPQDHMSPSGKPWHKCKSCEANPTHARCVLIDVTCTPELLGFEYMKHCPVSKNKHLIFWDRKLAEPQDIFLHPPHMLTPIAYPLLTAHPSPAATTPTFNVPPPNLNHTQYYNYNGTSSTFHPSKCPHNLTEEEAVAITCNFSSGNFYVSSSAPVRIDPRLPIRLTLGEGDHVHFTVGEALV
ncbi:hypothetical protein IW261DRAFT_1660378 [Armillaria novae-zelandiae]|uniref:Uncharacterized protein n=1 Tax=Armillaria novae-zelandiae TaxID=153914 RepID=A0AA39U849_9AGAR|nr:hypothetical protein IW261DRAFT_1660378 [Armillaria novae-zelandiae]